MARKNDNKEAMFEALSRGTGSSMRLPDWAKPSSPQPFEHPEMLEQPTKQKAAGKSEPQAVPEITIKIKAAAAGIARKLKSLKTRLDEKRLAAAERRLAAIEKARQDAEIRMFEAEQAQLKAEEEELVMAAATAAERQEAQPQPNETNAADTSDADEQASTSHDEAFSPKKVAEDDFFEEEEQPAAATEEYETGEQAEADESAKNVDEAEDADQNFPAEEETPFEAEEQSLFTSLQTEEEQTKESDDAEEFIEEIVIEEVEFEEAAETKPTPAENRQPPKHEKPQQPGEEAGLKTDEIKIPPSVSADDSQKSGQPAGDSSQDNDVAAGKTRPIEVIPSVTATSIQQQVNLAEDNALISQTLSARQAALETTPEDSVHITISRRAFIGIIGSALGIIIVVFLLGILISGGDSPKKPAAEPAAEENTPYQAQPQPSQETEPAEETAVAEEKPVKETPSADETPADTQDAPLVIAEENKRDPKRYYIVIQQLLSTGAKDRTEALNIAEFCSERGLPAEAVILDGKKLVVWSLAGLKSTDDEVARKHALDVEKLGKEYFKINRTYDFRQRMRDGRLRPYYIKGKPYATSADGK
ncbi:MAG TPA: hypothetical protein PKK48_05775 [Phycisphaerae bacterium]|nr:hypothetical protein [Phycisphaerae bacterium]